ncbi:hypothetical protein KF707_09215 [Candidatus Obscuribacterales bacterium]|nr:hypothetical protein [Candidatus Obscuribacterales bacterium]MBX3153646.1 hypothetical protein [Candidatus Obscuribacterales bacterium]
MAIRVGLMAAAIGLCLWASAMMPWAELDMNVDNLPHTFKLLHIEPVGKALGEIYGGSADKHKTHLESQKAEGKKGEYVYSLAIGLALLGAAIAIAAIGSADDEEKMTLPEKK